MSEYGLNIWWCQVLLCAEVCDVVGVMLLALTLKELKFSHSEDREGDDDNQTEQDGWRTYPVEFFAVSNNHVEDPCKGNSKKVC